MKTALILLVLAGCARPQAGIILATTTSVQDSGLLDELMPAFTIQTGIKVKVIAVGSGEAIAMARRGACDAVLAHSPKDEQKLAEDGIALDRATIMSNTFLIVGPADDPAGIKGMTSAKAAFEKIRGRLFASRGDKSGTHKRELDLWKEKPAGDWYKETQQGMGETLIYADQKGAYTLSDLATFCGFQSKVRLVVLVDGGDELINRYSVMRVKGGKEAASAWVEWMKKEAIPLIREFGKAKFGRPLFVPTLE